LKSIIRFYFRGLSVIVPKLAGSQAFELFQQPLNKKVRKKELPFYKMARHFTVKHSLEDIHCYELGSPSGKIVLLVHGWESNAASMSAIALKLAEDGHHVILFNLPAHGFSKLKKSNLKICKEVFLEVVNHLKPNQPFSVVAHSFGSAVTVYALSKTTYKVDKLIFLTSPNKIKTIFKDFGKFIGLNKASGRYMDQLASNLLKEPLENVAVANLGEKICYKCLLLIHDTDDRIIPISNSIAILNGWKQSMLHHVSGSGHYRMLWDQKVIDKISSTLQEQANQELKDYAHFAVAF